DGPSCWGPCSSAGASTRWPWARHAGWAPSRPSGASACCWGRCFWPWPRMGGPERPRRVKAGRTERLDGRQGASPVIFGEKGDSVLLGAVTLESLGVRLDALRRELGPLPMVLAPGLPGLVTEN